MNPSVSYNYGKIVELTGNQSKRRKTEFKSALLCLKKKNKKNCHILPIVKGLGVCVYISQPAQNGNETRN